MVEDDIFENKELTQKADNVTNSEEAMPVV